MNIRFFSLILFVIATACTPTAKDAGSLNDEPINRDTIATDTLTSIIDTLFPEEDLDEFAHGRDTSDLERTIIGQGLVNIKDVDPEIQTDIKYSTEDNFMSEDMYGEYAYCYLQPVVAEMLASAQGYVKENHPDLDLMIFDCVRPRSVQVKMWELVKGTDKQDYVAPPTAGSMHNYGAAIDLGLSHRDTGLVDMGTPYDFFGKLAQPRHEVAFVKSGELKQVHLDNRRILRAAMLRAGFHGILSEWWHFNAFKRDEVRARFQPVE